MADIASGSIHLTNQASIILPVTLVSADETQSVACEWRADPNTNQCGLYRVSDDAMLWGGIVLSDGTSGTVTNFLVEPGADGRARIDLEIEILDEVPETDANRVVRLRMIQPAYDGAANPSGTYPPASWPDPTGEAVAAWLWSQHNLVLKSDTEWGDLFFGGVTARSVLQLIAKDETSDGNNFIVSLKSPTYNANGKAEMVVPGVLTISDNKAGATNISDTLAGIMPYCKLSAPTSESLTYSSSTPCWVYDYKTVGLNDDGQYDLLLGGSGGKRQMGWIVPANGWYRVFLHARLTGGSSSKALMYVAVLPSTWTPPTVNYLALATLTDDADQLINNASLPISATNTYGDMVAEFYATAGKKIWPTVAMNDATKTIVTAESWASIQRIG